MATVRASIAEAIDVSGGKIEELTARLTEATEAASAEIFGEEFPGGRELIVEAAMRNLANMIANNWWLNTPEKVEAYCNQAKPLRGVAPSRHSKVPGGGRSWFTNACPDTRRSAFRNLEDLNAQLRHWLDTVAKPSRIGGRRRPVVIVLDNGPEPTLC